MCVCDISSLRVNGPSEPGRLRDVCVCQWVKFKTRPLFSQRSIFICSLDGRLSGPRPGLIREDREESVSPFGNQNQANSLSLSKFNTCSLLRNVFSAFLNKFVACKFCFSKVRI